MWNDGMIKHALKGDGFREPIAYVPQVRHQFERIGASQIQPASLDIRLGPDFLTHPHGTAFSLKLHPESVYRIQPGDCLLASTVERFLIPNDVVARVEGKSSLARLFLTVHSAGFIDPGFTGDITLELKNDGHEEIPLRAGMRIAQVSFTSLAAPAERPYGSPYLQSHYQGQWGPTVSANG